MVIKIRMIVPKYTPSPEIVALCDEDRHDVSSSYRTAPCHEMDVAV